MIHAAGTLTFVQALQEEGRGMLFLWQKTGVQKRNVLFVLVLFIRRVEDGFATKKVEHWEM